MDWVESTILFMFFLIKRLQNIESLYVTDKMEKFN